MRKLFLTSYRIQNLSALEELVGKKAGDIKVALLPNSKDYLSEVAWTFKNDELVEYLSNLGFDVTTVDLKKYNDPKQLKEELAKFDLIWGNGGNTYCMRYEMRRSGFEKILPELLDLGVVYGGESAGAIVAGTSLAGIESADEPGFSPEVIEQGLSLVDYVILTHVDNSDFAESIEEHRIAHENNPNVIELKDSQAAVFNDDEYEIID